MSRVLNFEQCIPAEVCVHNIFPYLHQRKVLQEFTQVCSSWRQAIIKETTTIHIYADRILESNHNACHDENTQMLDVHEEVGGYIRFLSKFLLRYNMNIEALFVNGSISEMINRKYNDTRNRCGKYEKFNSTIRMAEMRFTELAKQYRVLLNVWTFPSFVSFKPQPYISGNSMTNHLDFAFFEQEMTDIINVACRRAKFIVLENVFIGNCVKLLSNRDDLRVFVETNAYGNGYLVHKDLDMLSTDINSPSFQFGTTKYLSITQYHLESKTRESLSKVKHLVLKKVDLKKLDELLLSNDHIELLDLQIEALGDFEEALWSILEKCKALEHLSISLTVAYQPTHEMFRDLKRRELPRIKSITLKRHISLGFSKFIAQFSNSLESLAIEEVSYESYDHTEISQLKELKRLYLHSPDMNTVLNDLDMLLDAKRVEHKPQLESIILLDAHYSVNQPLLSKVCSKLDEGARLVLKYAINDLNEQTVKGLKNLTVHPKETLVNDFPEPNLSFGNRGFYERENKVKERKKFTELIAKLPTCCLECNMVVRRDQMERHNQLFHSQKEYLRQIKLEKRLDLKNYTYCCPSCMQDVQRKDSDTHVCSVQRKVKVYIENRQTRH